jgi:hypothetical protein
VRDVISKATNNVAFVFASVTDLTDFCPLAA